MFRIMFFSSLVCLFSPVCLADNFNSKQQILVNELEVKQQIDFYEDRNIPSFGSYFSKIGINDRYFYIPYRTDNNIDNSPEEIGMYKIHKPYVAYNLETLSLEQLNKPIFPYVYQGKNYTECSSEIFIEWRISPKSEKALVICDQQLELSHSEYGYIYDLKSGKILNRLDDLKRSEVDFIDENNLIVVKENFKESAIEVSKVDISTPNSDPNSILIKQIPVLPDERFRYLLNEDHLIIHPLRSSTAVRRDLNLNTGEVKSYDSFLNVDSDTVTVQREKQTYGYNSDYVYSDNLYINGERFVRKKVWRNSYLYDKSINTIYAYSDRILHSISLDTKEKKSSEIGYGMFDYQVLKQGFFTSLEDITLNHYLDILLPQEEYGISQKPLMELLKNPSSNHSHSIYHIGLNEKTYNSHYKSYDLNSRTFKIYRVTKHSADRYIGSVYETYRKNPSWTDEYPGNGTPLKMFDIIEWIDRTGGPITYTLKVETQLRVIEWKKENPNIQEIFENDVYTFEVSIKKNPNPNQGWNLIWVTTKNKKTGEVYQDQYF